MCSSNTVWPVNHSNASKGVPMVPQVDSSSVLNTPSSVTSSSARVGVGNPPVELALKTSPDNHLGSSVTTEESVYTSAIPESLEDNLLQVGGSNLVQ